MVSPGSRPLLPGSTPEPLVYEGVDLRPPLHGNHLTPLLPNPPQSPRFVPLSTSAPPTPLNRVASRRNLLESIGTLSKTKHYLKSAARWAYLPIARLETKTKAHEAYIIEYSVFRPIRGLPKIDSEAQLQEHWHGVRDPSDQGVFPENYISEEAFMRLLDEVLEVISLPLYVPRRISQGSSGSYFIMNRRVVEFGIEQPYIAAVFKPKDEEPYGPLLPKWTKWFHRTFFPWFFGRLCLLPNVGYASEVAASVLDAQLLSYIVPHTEIVYLKSNSFYSGYWDRKTRNKVGLFQLFLRGYEEAQTWLKEHPIPLDPHTLPPTFSVKVDVDDSSTPKFQWSQRSLQQFREELEKLVILDYIMRNTDRGLDNWMIRVDWNAKIVHLDGGRHKRLTPFIRIGAIDLGLAFPWKHPDEWRSFPFGWLFLPLSLIGQPFSHKTRQHYLPLLTSKFWWESTVTKLRAVFEQDANFKPRQWRSQLAVLKGQAFNVVEILKLAYAGPLELTRRETLLIWDDTMNMPVTINNDTLSEAMETSLYDLSYPKKSISTIVESDPEEDTPLLRSQGMSGFDYNLTHDEQNETNTRSVVIERLEKVNARSPVFTWC